MVMNIIHSMNAQLMLCIMMWLDISTHGCYTHKFTYNTMLFFKHDRYDVENRLIQESLSICIHYTEPACLDISMHEGMYVCFN